MSFTYVKAVFREAIQGTLKSSLKMWIIKNLINIAAWLLTPLIPTVPPKGENVAMIKYTFAIMRRTAMIQQRADNDPHRKRDYNFIRLLNFMEKGLLYLAGRDPFYYIWMGYFFKHAGLTYELTRVDYEVRLQVLNDHIPADIFTPKFRNRAFNLKTSGGLHLIDEQYGDTIDNVATWEAPR